MYGRGALLSRVLGPLSDVPERSPRGRTGLGKQPRAGRGRQHPQSVDGLEVRVPCQKREQEEPGNVCLLFFPGGVETCHREEGHPGRRSAFVPRELGEASLSAPRGPRAGRQGGKSPIPARFL